MQDVATPRRGVSSGKLTRDCDCHSGHCRLALISTYTPIRNINAIYQKPRITVIVFDYRHVLVHK